MMFLNFVEAEWNDSCNQNDDLYPPHDVIIG